MSVSVCESGSGREERGRGNLPLRRVVRRLRELEETEVEERRVEEEDREG